MTTTRGIVLIATNNRHYGKLACNLCASIKALSKEQVCLIHDDRSLDSIDSINLFIFDQKVQVSGDGFSLKLNLFYLSPFDKTLFIDADTLFTPLANIGKLFDELDGTGFTIANRGLSSNTSDWIDVGKAKEEYKLKEWVDTSSEFIYFEKGYPAQSIFDAAKDFYLNNKLVHRTIGGYQPDEPAFSFGMAINEVRPHKLPYYPCYWDAQEKITKSESDIRENYLLLSMGGNVNSEKVRKLYKRWCDYYCRQLGVNSYPHINKREVTDLNRKAI